METNALFALMFGLVVRLGLPMLVTLLVVIGLRRLDTRWQKEAEIERNLLTRDEEPCWKEQGLAMDEIKARAAENGNPAGRSIVFRTDTCVKPASIAKSLSMRPPWRLSNRRRTPKINKEMQYVFTF